MALVLNVCIRAKTCHSPGAASDLGAVGLRVGLDEETLVLLAGLVKLPSV